MHSCLDIRNILILEVCLERLHGIRERKVRIFLLILNLRKVQLLGIGENTYVIPQLQNLRVVKGTTICLILNPQRWYLEKRDYIKYFLLKILL